MSEDGIEARNGLAALLAGQGLMDLAERVRAVPAEDVDKLILGIWHKPDCERSEDMVEDLQRRPRFLSGDGIESFKKTARSEALGRHPVFLLGIEAYEALYESSGCGDPA
jgi:hypothetical protein